MLTNEHIHMAMIDVCADMFGMPSSDFSVWLDTMDVIGEEHIRMFFRYKNEQFYMGKFYSTTTLENIVGLASAFTTYAKNTKEMFYMHEVVSVVMDEFQKAKLMIQSHVHNPLYDEEGVRELLHVTMESFLDMLYTLVEAQRSIDNAVGKA